MKIALSNATRGWWGTTVMADLLARGLRDRGHEVVLFCRAGSDLHERLHGEVVCEPILSGIDLNLLAHGRCLRALRRHRPDLVVTHVDKDLRSTGVAARMLGIPVVMRQETDYPFKRRLRYRLFHGSVAMHHITNSHATLRTLLASAPWLRPSVTTVIPNGIDPEPFIRAVAADLGLPGGAAILGFVGRFEERKGIHELVQAWPRIAAALPHAHLVIAGSGSEEREFRAGLAGAPRVHWLGPRTDVPAVMKALDVLAMPSHFEGFGLVAVEAMAAGVPVVAARASSLPEIVSDGVEGCLVPPRDPSALADAVIALLLDPAGRARMGERGRARVYRDFTLERMLDRHEELFARFARNGS